MDKQIRKFTTAFGVMALLLVVAVAAWASMAPVQLSVKPTVTIKQAVGQADPTNRAPIHFTAVFSKTVKDFAAGDVTLSGTAPGTLIKTVTGSGTKYDVAITGMTGSGTVIATLAAGVAHDAVGNPNTASTSTDKTVTYDVTPPTITIGAPSALLTQSGPITYTITYGGANSVTLTSARITLNRTGTANGTVSVSGSGTTTRTVTIASITGDGTLGISISAGTAADTAGNTAPTAGPSATFIVDSTSPSVTINQAIGQADPTNSAPIHFTVVFSEVVTDFTAGDVTISGSALGMFTKTVTGSGTTYDVAVSGMTGSGTVIASLAAGVAHDALGHGSTASTSTDKTVTYDVAPLTSTINQAIGQADPTNSAPIHFSVVFSKVVTDFTAGDVTLSGTAPGLLAITVTGSGSSYDVAVTGMTGSGTVIASLAAGVAHDIAGNASTTATFTDDTVTYDLTPLTVTIDQAVGQLDPTNSAPIHFTVVFSKVVTDFADGNVTLTGTAPGTLVATVTGTGTTTYDVAVTGMTDSGTVIATLAAGVAHDVAGNANTAATTTDNTVTYDVTPPTVTINQAVGQLDSTMTTPIHFTVVFSEPVTVFVDDVILTGTAPGTLTQTVTGSGTTYDVAVTGMTGSGTVIATLAPGVTYDVAGNASMPATSTDNTVTYIDVLGASAAFGGFGGGAGLTNQGIDTIIYGDIGTTGASTTVTGFHDSTGDRYIETGSNVGSVTGRIYTAAPPPVIFISGGPYGGNAATKLIADAAALDALSAYNYLASLATTGPDPSASGELSGLTLAPGVYKAAGDTFNIQPGGTLTLDAQGNPDAIWIFQMGSSLTVGSIGLAPAMVVFKDGVGQASNVYWQVGSAATINTGAIMEGTIIAYAGITFSTVGQVDITTLNGRALSLNASVTMVNTHINLP
ncbi:MAG TPA: ice-binding family protein [Armatimonadota bacterium]|jgi:hypothetical protein